LRKNVEEMTETEQFIYASNFEKILKISLEIQSDNRGFYNLAGYHGYPNYWCWHHLERMRENRRMRLFFPWHRAYLYNLELRLQDDTTDIVAIPWWDWSSSSSHNNGIPNLFTAKELGGKPNPLISFPMPKDIPRDSLPDGTADPPQTWRLPDPNTSLPTPASISYALSKSDFEDAELFIEDLHDKMHGWVGGTMGAVATSAYDPIFYSHHCMIDRIWYLWQKQHGNASGLEDLLDECLPPFPQKVRNVLDIHQLNYDYAVSSRTIEI